MSAAEPPTNHEIRGLNFMDLLGFPGTVSAIMSLHVLKLFLLQNRNWL
jgi:hypothetical protein